MLNISVGYAITDDLSAGVSFERAGFLTNKEDSSKVTALNPSIYVAYNIVNNDKFTFYTKADYGMSMLNFQSEKVHSVKNNILVKSTSWIKLNIDLGIKNTFQII